MRTLLIAALAISLAGCGNGQPQPDTGQRVRHWIESLRAADVRHRQEAAFRLGNLAGEDPGTVVPALAAALNDGDTEVRCAAILALLKCGSGARAAIPALTEARDKDRVGKVRGYAARALEKIKSGA